MSLLRLWFAASAGVLLLLFLYAFAPIVLAFLVVTAGFGVLTAGIVAAARWLERQRDRH